ncbi:MAG: dihydroxyacetone kinase subunit DhaK [Spirochaetota bacterium]
MKKFINKPEDIVDELIQGLVKSHSHILQLLENNIIIRRHPKPKGKVQIVFGQGIGHEPGYDGMLGYGMHDVEVPGGIFACSGGDRIYEGIKTAWEMSGNTPVLSLIANHEGDVINGNLANEMARDEGIDVESVLLYDDIASAPKGEEENRRGMAGMTFSFKAAGAMAEEGKSREEIIQKVKQVNAATRTLSVALRPCTIPTTGQYLFDLAEDELIIGPGVHGEAGPEGPLKVMSANEVMDIVADRVIKDGEYKNGDEVLVLINGSGSTTLMEMFILYNRLEEILNNKNIRPYKPLIGNFITTQEMAGFSLSMCRANDEIKKLWDAPANTPYFKVCSKVD